MKTWTIKHARELYNICHWGNNFFDVNSEGNLYAVNLANPAHSGVDLFKLCQEIKQKGLSLPVLVRFTHILHHRIQQLTDGFDLALKNHHYTGTFTPVYPIKVNQQYGVVNEIAHHPTCQVGLESGSKTELMTVLALANSEKSVIVCNGYKDREYIRLALMGSQMGHRVFIVLEKLSELDLVLEESEKLNITPNVGIRIKLSSVGRGLWQNTGGEKSKFGLPANQILAVIERLKSEQKLSCLQLLHFHLGSQIPELKYIESGMRESARYVTELHQLGCHIQYVDVGGGLSVDYDGTASENEFSMNYTLEQYADCIVHTLANVCSKHNIPHPHIITESGRAMTAHHAVLITNVIEADQPLSITTDEKPHVENSHIKTLLTSLTALQSGTGRVTELYRQANQAFQQIKSQFFEGDLDILQRAYAEQIHTSVCQLLVKCLDPQKSHQREILDELNEKLVDKYFCNFSLFQSLPDVWALKQVFPIMPLHRLNEQPTQRGVIRDITCDSDGRIDKYIDGEGIEPSLPLHKLNRGQEYLIGFFLVGAYQEILGDMHNLFGDTHSVNINFTENSYNMTNIQRGESVDYILRHIRFEPDDLYKIYQQKIKSANLDPNQAENYLAELKSGLTGYSYLEDA